MIVEFDMLARLFLSKNSKQRDNREKRMALWLFVVFFVKLVYRVSLDVIFFAFLVNKIEVINCKLNPTT